MRNTAIFLIALLHSSCILFGQPDPWISMDDNPQKLGAGKYHAIIISESNYSDEKIPDLNEPEKDADKLKSLLLSKYYFNVQDIVRLIDPTRTEIIDAIEYKRKTLSFDDNLLIFFAGHGFWDENLKMGYWLPSDAQQESKGNWVSNNDLTVYLSAIESNHILLISDACFSGGIFKNRSIGDMSSGTKRLYETRSRKAITSGNLSEVPDNSVFMKFFLKELESNKTPFLTTDQIFAQIRPQILNNSNTEPLYGVIHNTGDEGGEFVFYSPANQLDLTAGEEIELANAIVNHERRAAQARIHEENRVLPSPKRVAILNFDSTIDDPSQMVDLGGPLRDMLTTDLSEVQNLSMVDRQALEKVLAEQNLNNTKRFDRDKATEIGKLLGAEMIISGTYFEFYGQLRVDAKLIDVETGEIAFSVGVDGSREKLFDLKALLANQIIEKLR